MPLLKVRYCARVPAGLRQLFSAQQRKDGALILTLSGAKFAFHENENERVKITGQKISVHMSPNSRGNVVHYTCQYEGRENFETHLYTEAIPNGKIQPIFETLFRDLSGAPALNGKKSDVMQEVCSFDPRVNTLLMQVAIGPISPDLYSGLSSNFCQNVVAFYQEFALVISLGYTYVPSAPVGISSFVGSSLQGAGPEMQFPQEGFAPADFLNLTRFKLGLHHNDAIDYFIGKSREFELDVDDADFSASMEAIKTAGPRPKPAQKPKR